jgi:hypothetical protein
MRAELLILNQETILISVVVVTHVQVMHLVV